MKHLLYIMLLALALPARSQDLGIASLRFSYAPADSPAVHREYLKTRHRPKGTIGTIIGVSLIGIGGTLMSRPQADDLRGTGLMLYLVGVPTTAISGIVLLSHLHERHRYSLFIGNGNAGIAYSF